MTDLPKREELLKRRVRFVVPAREPHGVDLKTLNMAIREALADRERRGLSNEYDDALRFMAEDRDGGEIVIFFDVEEPAQGSAFSELPFLNPCLHADEHNATISWPGTLDNLRHDHKMRVVVHSCARQTCRTRIVRQIRDITGQLAVVEDYPER